MSHPAPGGRDLARFEGRFVALWSRMTGGQGDPAPIWHAVRAAYESAARHYHGPGHLAFCLAALDDAAMSGIDARIVETAIWFHDLVLVPGAHDNEYESARWLEAAARPWLAEDVLASVTRLIMATTHRTSVQALDEQLICDIDLASLGAPWERFVEDCDGLRAESTAPEVDYVRGKLAFYGALLARPAIYYTAHFQRGFEASARQNIERYCALLRSGAPRARDGE